MKIGNCEYCSLEYLHKICTEFIFYFNAHLFFSKCDTYDKTTKMMQSPSWKLQLTANAKRNFRYYSSSQRVKRWRNYALEGQL